MVARPDSQHFSLDLLHAHGADYAWLGDHYDRLCEQIHDELRTPGVVGTALEKLDVIIHYVISREDLDRWCKPLYDALLVTMNAADEAQQMRVWSHLGSIYLRSGNYRSASQTLAMALKLPETALTQDTMLLARIGWLSLRGIFYAHDIDIFIMETLDAAQYTQRQDLRAWLYFNIGQVYNHLARTVEAMSYLQCAYVLWHGLANKRQQRNALLAMAEACRVGGRSELSMRYIKLAGEEHSEAYGDGIRCYHEGTLLIKTAHYDEAARTLEQALALFQAIKYPYLIASARHALGIAYTYLGFYDQAQEQLEAALTEWAKNNHLYQHAAVVHALGYLFQMQEDFATARRQYQDALQLLAELPAAPVIVKQRQDIEDDLLSLPDSP